MACWTACNSDVLRSLLFARSSTVSNCLPSSVDRPIADAVVIQLPDHHGAGSAVAFRTAFLGTLQSLVFTQVLQHCPGGVATANLLYLVCQNKSNSIVHLYQSLFSATTIGAVAERGEQQRHVVVLVFAVDAEPNHNLVQEPVFAVFLTLCIEILTGVEN